MHARMQNDSGIPKKIEMTKLRNANINESEEILKFYRNIILSIKGSEFQPKWNDAYPDLEFIEDSILKDEMYVYSENNDLISCVVINSEFGEEYDNIKWQVNTKSSETVVIHAFAVNTMGKGIGKEIFKEIVENAIENNKKTIKIDLIDGNIGAKIVFEKLGFTYIDSVKMFHEAVGLETFHIYEKLL